MNAAPIAHYLLELGAADGPLASASGVRVGGPPKTARPTPLEEAHAKGFESGKAAAEAQLAGKLEEREALHRSALAAAREAWTSEESSLLAEQFAKGLQDLEARLADAAARILKPFLAAQLQKRAVADLADCLAVLRARDEAAAICVAGAPDLLEALRCRLGGSLGNITYRPDTASDVRVAVGQTVLETRIGAWMARIEEAVA
jgi:hypothetical protein